MSLQGKELGKHRRISESLKKEIFKLSAQNTTMKGALAMNQTITKKKLINSISREKNVHPNDVRTIIQAFLDHMTDSLAKGDRLEFRDFGVFEVVERKQKIGRNPKNAAVPIIIPSRKAVKFTPGKKMRRQVEALAEEAGAQEATEQTENMAEAIAQNPMNLSSL